LNVIAKFKGTLCQNGTSCVAQIAKALERVLSTAVADNYWLWANKKALWDAVLSATPLNTGLFCK